MYGPGSQSWAYNFKVINHTIPLWVYGAGLAGFIVIILILKNLPIIWLKRILWTALGIVFLSGIEFGLIYREKKKLMEQAEARTKEEEVSWCLITTIPLCVLIGLTPRFFCSDSRGETRLGII